MAKRVSKEQKSIYDQRYLNKKPERRKKAAERAMEHQRSKRYGLSPDAFAILKNKTTSCPICKVPLRWNEGPKFERAHIDHDHTTGKVRDLLCGRCNCGLGNFQDNPELLNHAVAYLLQHAKKGG